MNISNLATQHPALANEVYVHNYAIAGDGGGGYFAWKITAELPAGAAANTGIWFAGPIAGGLLERQFSKQGAVNVQWFGAKGDAVANDTVAIQNTINFASSFGFSVFIPKGTYLVDSILLKSNISIFGEGDLSVLQFLNDPAQYIFFVDTQNGSTANNIKNVRISNLKFFSSFLFSQFKHFLCLNGVSDFVIEKCLFMQFRGDAVYLGAGVGANKHITHNENLTIRDCRFDGVGKTNRNAISILDCNQLIIENNYFTNCSRSDMPGPIDIEPDPPVSGVMNEILKNINVQKNSFYNTGGVACFLVQLPPYPFTVTPSGIYFSNNGVENAPRGVVYTYKYVPNGLIETKEKISFFIENNVFKNVSLNGLEIQGSSQTKISGNYINAANTNTIGYDTLNETVIDMILTNNYFDKCGTASGYGLLIYNCKRVKFNSNIFNDCGPIAGGGVAILFNGGTTPCTSDFISFDQNIFLTPSGRTSVGIQKSSFHNFSPRNNRFINNQFNGMSSAFEYINDNNFGLLIGISPALSVTIPHNLGNTPKWASVQPQSANVSGIKNITVDSINITVTFTTTPVGSINLFWSVQV